jgi:hypothetical protein
MKQSPALAWDSSLALPVISKSYQLTSSPLDNIVLHSYKGDNGKDNVDPVLDQAPRRESVGGNRGIAPRILNVGTRWTSVFNFTPRPLYP